MKLDLGSQFIDEMQIENFLGRAGQLLRCNPGAVWKLDCSVAMLMGCG